MNIIIIFFFFFFFLLISSFKPWTFLLENCFCCAWADARLMLCTGEGTGALLLTSKQIAMKAAQTAWTRLLFIFTINLVFY
jgi:hypothetical protein